MAALDKIDPRKPPYWEVQRQHPQDVKGTCAWCGKPTEDKTESGRIAKYHHACKDELLCIVRPEVMRGFVFARDKGICANCGEDWSQKSRFVPEIYVRDWQSYYTPDMVTPGPCGKRMVRVDFVHDGERGDWRKPDTRPRYPYVSVIAISLWHVEHTVPLWKVAHMPPVERIEYFKLAAVKTYCTPCHKVKSRKEAAEKAKYDRREREKAEAKMLRPPPAKKSGRKLRGQSFQKGYRPMRGRR